jgi:hypothetical protein
MNLRKKFAAAALIAAIVVSLVAYVWVARDGGVQAGENEETPRDVTEFKAVINGMSSMDVSVCVDVSDGLTLGEAELIVGTAFILVMGDYVTHRLDTLAFDDTQIEAHYAWGHDESDMGHVFDLTADLIALQIVVSHCF